MKHSDNKSRRNNEGIAAKHSNALYKFLIHDDNSIGGQTKLVVPPNCGYEGLHCSTKNTIYGHKTNCKKQWPAIDPNFVRLQASFDHNCHIKQIPSLTTGTR